MNCLILFRKTLLGATFAIAMAASPVAVADFADTFDAAGDVASLYSYFQLSSGVSGGGVDSHIFSDGSSFALDVAGSDVDMFQPDGGFDFVRLSRSGDTANHYNVTQSTTITAEVSGLSATFFDAIRNPVVFGLDFETGDDISVQVQRIDFAPTTRVEVNLPGGAAANYAVSSDFTAMVLSIDATSYSLSIGGTTIIPTTAHGRVIDPFNAAIPFFEARRVFGGGTTTFAMERFEGTGTTAVPEPATISLVLIGGLLLIARRIRG